MNRFISIAILSILHFTNCFSQTCGNDSVVTRYTQEKNNGIRTNKIYVDSFDLTNGRVYSSVHNISNNTSGGIIRTQGTFVKKLISYNALHDTIEYVELQGTGTGFADLNKIEFAYTPSVKPLSRIHSHWNGSIWTISKSEVWTYNGSELILNYILSDSTGFISQRNYFYSGNQQTSIQFQNYSGGSWRNIERYQITYQSTGLRDSLILQRWDLPTGLWIDSIHAKYDTVSYCVSLYRDDFATNDSVRYIIDSLNNIIYYSHHYYSGTDSESYSYDYFNNHLKLVSYGSHSAFPQNTSYTYDVYGLLMFEEFHAYSNTGSTSVYHRYDSLSNLINYEHSSGYITGDTYENTSYAYSSATHISLAYAYSTDTWNGLSCQGDSIIAFPVAAGGCGPLTYSWSPSIGLSADSIASPLVLFKDSVLYTITVTDTIGQTTTTTFLADPDRKLTITFDSTLCSGCPVELHATPGYTYYYWYRNDTLIIDGNQNFIAIESGRYTVRVNQLCALISDPIELTLNGYTRIKGHVYLDKDSDCVFNNADINLDFYGPTPFLVKLERQNYSVIVNTDSSGNYDLPIDTGNFRISLLNPSNLLEYSCPDSGAIHVYIPNFGDTISGNDFGLKTKYSCNRLRVVTTSSAFRPCSNSTISVTCFNEGSEVENDPVVNLRLPNELSNISSLFPFTVLPDNVYQFSLPPIQIGTHFRFSLSADVVCDPAGLQNATLCIDADISPVTFCSYEPDSLWDGSYIRVFSSCENDSSCFTIYNISDTSSNMDSPSNWRLYADNVLVQQGSFQLLAGEDTTLCFISDGKTLRLEAEQTNLFPVTGIPKANIERCGPLLSGQSYSLNYILQSAPDNSVPFHYTHCSVVRNSLDPNEKLVTPIGIGPDHITEPDERFTYRINFQNRGNDTAHFVKIVDQLNNNFDLSTIQLLSSSHPYNFSLIDHELIWQFDPILLPDSNIDEANSHGFVEFSLNLKPSVFQGAQITNSAQVFFDSNSPIVTNITRNKICTPEIPTINIFPVTDLCSGRISFTSAMQFEGSFPVVKWYINGSYFTTDRDTVEFQGLGYNDIISATLKSNATCSLNDSVTSNLVQITGSAPTISYSWPTLTSTPGSSYVWLLNNLIIAGATSQTYTPTASGNYSVQVTDSTGCSFFSLAFPFIYTGTPENISNSTKVYPNPSNGKFIVETISGNKSVTLIDYTGRSLMQFDTKEKNFTIDISNKFSSGIYYLIIRCGDEVSYERIIYQR